MYNVWVHNKETRKERLRLSLYVLIHSVAESSLSPESVEQVLSALSRQKSVGNVRLSVTTITVTTAALCLDFIQNTETSRHLKWEQQDC